MGDFNIDLLQIDNDNNSCNFFDILSAQGFRPLKASSHRECHEREDDEIGVLRGVGEVRCGGVVGVLVLLPKCQGLVAFFEKKLNMDDCN